MIVVFVLGFVIFAIVIMVIAGELDSDRIGQEIQSKNGKLISKEWEPFGKGWFGEQSDRIYRIQYLDKDGHLHEALVKTSMFTGVYFTDDKIIKYSEKNIGQFTKSVDEITNLKAENDKLKGELFKLQKQISGRNS